MEKADSENKGEDSGKGAQSRDSGLKDRKETVPQELDCAHLGRDGSGYGVKICGLKHKEETDLQVLNSASLDSLAELL